MQTVNKESTEAQTEAHPKWIDPIEKDDLTEVAVIINSLRYISGDILDDYFYKFKPNKNKDDAMYCVHYHERYRAYMDVVFSGIRTIEEILIQNGITI